MSRHFQTICAHRGAVWNWCSISIGIFERLPNGLKSPVKVRVIAPLNQEGIDKAKIVTARIIAELDAGAYIGPTLVKLRLRN